MLAAPQSAAAANLAIEKAIRRLLDEFYGKVSRDPQLGPMFARAVGIVDADRAPHLARAADFRSSLMPQSGRNPGKPISTHLCLPDLEPAMFNRCLALFEETCADMFDPDLADTFRERMERIVLRLRMRQFERLSVEHAWGSPEKEMIL